MPGQERTVVIPWPPSKTSKNGSQGDYFGKSRAAKAYKHTCLQECDVQKVTPFDPVPEGNVAVTITYHPPTNGRNDWDNLAGRAKQGWDAIAEKTGVDDARWWPVTSRKGEKIKGGKIVVHIENSDGSTEIPGLMYQTHQPSKGGEC